MIREERETTGASYQELAKRYGLSDVGIMKRAKREGWVGSGPDCAERVRVKAAEKVAGVDRADNDAKREAAIDRAAERAASILKRHQEEPEAPRRIVHASLRCIEDANAELCKRLEPEFAAALLANKAAAREDIKAAKAAAEALAVCQLMERRAFMLDSTTHKLEITQAVDYTKLSDAALEEIVNATASPAT